MQNSPQIKETDKILLKIASGVILSIMFLLLGFLINDALNREITPSFENIVSKNIIILFLGLLSGYNISSSLNKEKSAYYFYAGIFIPIFIVVLFGLLTNSEYHSAILLVLGLSFPIIFIHSGLVESHPKFELFIDLFAKFIPNITVMTLAVGDFCIPIIGNYANFDIGAYSYIAGIAISLFVLYIIKGFEEEIKRNQRRN